MRDRGSKWLACMQLPSGHVTVAPLRSVMNSRRSTGTPPRKSGCPTLPKMENRWLATPGFTSADASTGPPMLRIASTRSLPPPRFRASSRALRHAACTALPTLAIVIEPPCKFLLASFSANKWHMMAHAWRSWHTGRCSDSDSETEQVMTDARDGTGRAGRARFSPLRDRFAPSSGNCVSCANLCHCATTFRRMARMAQAQTEAISAPSSLSPHQRT
jgi:hypothetical protein